MTTEAQKDTTQEAFATAMVAKRRMDESWSPEARERYLEARGKYRVQVVELILSRLSDLVEDYLAGSHQVMGAWEEARDLAEFLSVEGINPGLSRKFLEDVRLPLPLPGMSNFADGVEAPAFLGIDDLLTEDGLRMWSDNWAPEVDPPAPPTKFERTPKITDPLGHY